MKKSSNSAGQQFHQTKQPLFTSNHRT